jgi:dTDP-4-amino-4,6-dideoxygalactose transaminase
MSETMTSTVTPASTRPDAPIALVAPIVGADEMEAVARVLRSGQLAQGPEVAEFEREFAAVAGTKHAVAVNSGTASIHAALVAAGIGDGDEVLTTPFTFAATATPILMQRAIPRYVDIDEQTFNVDGAGYARAVNGKTKAIVAVDLFGMPVDTRGLEDARARGVTLVEDACQAIGARRNRRPAGAIGDIGCFSLYATKNIMTGEGGMLTTDDDEAAAAARRFRQHGQGERYEYLSLGYNYRMTDLAAAIGRAQLRRLHHVTARRRENAALYDTLLRDVPGARIPPVPPGVEHAYHQYSILVDETRTPNSAGRDDVRKALAGAAIATGVYYPTPLHLNPLFSKLGYGPGDFPVAERVAQRVLALPVHPTLSADDVRRVAAEIARAVGA